MDWGPLLSLPGETMILSTSQPYFAPYPGFFYKVYRADMLVVLDDVQFPQSTTWITRNRFKNDQGMLWMTIPVLKKGLGLQKISTVKICHSGNWKTKHLRSFRSAYAHAPYLADHLGLMERVLSGRYDYILDLNMEIMRYILDFLHINTQVIMMSQLNVSGKGQQLIIDICKAVGATQYLVQSSALAYYDRPRFETAGIELVALKTPDFIYPQMWADFIANLSILDMIFNIGPKSRDIVLG